MIVVMSADDLMTALPSATGRPLHTVDLATGEAFFRRGDPPRGLAFVVSGRVELMRWTSAGDPVRVHTAHPGESFAEASIFEERCHCDGIAVRPSKVRFAPRSDVLAAISAAPDLAIALTRHLALALVAARRLIELRAVHPLSARALVYLTEFAQPDGSLPAGRTLASMADDLAVSPPALYRTLARLERNGQIARPARGRVRLLPSTETVAATRFRAGG